MPKQNATLLRLEKLLSCSSAEAARVLGVGYSTYQAYRAGTRVLPKYHANHCVLFNALSNARRAEVVKELLNGR